jgi:phosphoribosylaminoimidazole-succinocarboxamide synthase
MKLVRTGKVKQVYEVGEDTLEFMFTDNISVFDKIVPSQIPFKGETLCRTAAFWFQLCRKAGIKTHFTELVPPNRMRVKRVEVITDYSKIDRSTTNYLIPLEIISRQYVAGSLYDRIKNKEINVRDLGFPQGHEVKYGDKLPIPFYETTTKLEKVDRLLTREEALSISGLSEEEMDNMFKVVEEIDNIIDSEVEERMLIHVDGKKEFALDEHRRLMLVDTFGTADEDRWWDDDAYETGEFVELSKEAVRQYYRSTGFYDQLMEARNNKQPEPPIPPLPESEVQKVSELYIEMFERLTGESFR